MKKLFVVLIVLLLATASVQAVSISITATNKGSSVSVVHHYSAVGDANYKAEGKGKVSFGSVDVSESFNFKGEVKEQGENFAEANHLILGENYGIGSNHYLNGSSGTGSISESGSINAGDEGKMSKSVNDDVAGQGDPVAISSTTVSNGNDRAETSYELYNGKLSGSQSVSTGSASASQSFSGSGIISFGSCAAKDADNDSNINEFASAGCFPIIADNINASTSATTNPVSASMNVDIKSGSIIKWLGLTTAKDTDNDGTIDDRITDVYVVGDFTFTQFNANGYANTANEESYMEGYGAGSSLTGYAYAGVDGSSDDDNVNINNVNYSLHAWIDENNVPKVNINTWR